MIVDEIDSEPKLVTPAKKIVEKSIGIVLMGLIVLFAFAFFLSGIIRVQDVSTLQTRDVTRSANAYGRTAEPRYPDIGDVKTEERAKPDLGNLE